MRDLHNMRKHKKTAQYWEAGHESRTDSFVNVINVFS